MRYKPNAWIHRLDHAVLDCVRMIHGPVALYWLIPLLYAMCGDRLGLWQRTADGAMPRTVEMPSRRCADAHEARRLCDSLPVGCDIVHQTAPTTVRHRRATAVQNGAVGHPTAVDRILLWLPLPRTVTGGTNTADRIESRRRSRVLSNPDTMARRDELHLLSAGSILLAMAMVAYNDTDEMLLNQLCSAMRSRGGTYLVKTLRPDVPVDDDAPTCTSAAKKTRRVGVS